MPRARIPDASLAAGADALFLPWLAPRAFAESPVLRRRRRDGRSYSTQTSAARAEISHARTIAVGDGSSCPRRQPRTGTTLLCRAPTRTALDLRYADIASFAHRYARSYTTGTEAFTTTPTVSTTTSATGTESSAQATTHQAPHEMGTVPKDSTGSRYSRRRSWKDELLRYAKDLTPEEAGRVRMKHIAVAEARLERQVERLQRDRLRYRIKPLYDGQYRSLRRSILSLKRWRETTEDVRKDNCVDPDDEHWIVRTFAALDRSTYAHTNTLTKPVTLQHDARCRRYTSTLFAEVDENSPERLWTNWQDLGENKKFYESILVYMLDQQPGHAQDFIPILAADASLPDSKSVILADALAHLAKLHVKGEYSLDQGWGLTPNALARKFISTFLLCTRFLNTAAYSQDLLHSLVLLADTADLQKIYDALNKSKTRLSMGTVLHYASAFGEAGEFHYALQCLERRLAAFNETERALVVDTERFRWTCAAILRGSMREANNYHETPSIVEVFVGFGVKMDLLLYDVVMRNAMDAGDFGTAFKVYNALDQNGLVPDKYTFSILLHGCTKQSDPAMFKAFADWCAKQAKELADPWLASDCLYYAYICEQNKRTSARDTGLLWRTYLDLFDLSPLELFSRYGSRPMKDAIDQQVEPSTEKLAPTPMALYLMLQTEIQTTRALGINYLERLYKTFKRALLKEPHPTLASLAQTPVIWNAFLYAFCVQQQYASASQVIKDMTAHGPAPNIYSWNIFMQSFFKTGQVAAADRVFAIMRDRGINPDAYTYGVMVRGYAKAQLVDRIGDTMQHISEEDQLDPELLRLLAQVQKRQDLAVALEKSRIEKEAKEVEAKERAEREEQKRFETPRFASLLTNALRFRPAPHWDNGVAGDDFMEPDDEDVKVESEALDNPTDAEASQPLEQDSKFKSLFDERT